MASLAPYQGSLGQKKAAHLLRRTSFRYTKQRVDQLASMNSDQAANSILTLNAFKLDQPLFDDPNTPTVEQVTWLIPPGQTFPTMDEFPLQYRVIGWWLNESLEDAGIGQKMSFFFHQFFATNITTYNHASFFDYLLLLRWCALGNLKKLATKIVSDNTMLLYLNGHQNSKASPNENFAREFFELFTVGKGPQIAPGDYTNYTEDDIVQAAKVCTGWRFQSTRLNLDPETGIPRGTTQLSRHDTTNKTFSSKFQNTVITGATTAAAMYTELDAFVTMVFNHPETARNFVRRIYRYFVHTNITQEIEQDIIEPLAETLRTSNYDIVPMMRKLFRSQHFFDMDDSTNADEIIGGLIRSPLDLSLQSISFYGITIPSPYTENIKHYFTFYGSGVYERMLGLANLSLFYPPDVAGYTAYHQGPEFSRHWFSSTSIISRYKLPQMLLTGKRVVGNSPNSSIGIKLDIVPWIKNNGITQDPSNAFELVKDLLDYLLPAEIDSDRFNYFYDQIFLDGLPPSDWTYEWQNYLATNNQTEVKIPLERLIFHIMYSPEYQTF
ncbi:MAG: DUF1800 family protein [Saprospiraceae bacterium]